MNIEEESRKLFNKKILKLMEKTLEDRDLRFCQFLSSLDLDKDKFYEESQETYFNIVEKLIKKNSDLIKSEDC